MLSRAVAPTGGCHLLRVPWSDATLAQIRRTILVIALAGFAAGYYVLLNEWFQIGWLLFCFCLMAMLGWTLKSGVALLGSRSLGPALSFICWNLVASFIATTAASWDKGVFCWVWGAGLLILWMILMLEAGGIPGFGNVIGWTVVISAAVAVVFSLVWFLFVLHAFSPLDRLRNILVYRGLNAVCTGLTFAFAAMWAACLRRNGLSRKWRLVLDTMQVMILFGVCCTQSRGALLALLAGHVALLLARGWHHAWCHWAMFLGTLLAFQFIQPPLTHKMSLAGSPLSESAAPEDLAPLAVPAREWLERRDSGRIDIYLAALGAQETWSEKLLGLGLWSSEDRWMCGLADKPNHLHSIFLASYVHGGWIGLALMLNMMARGFRNAWISAREGEDVWLVLLSFGVAGLLFDGQTLAVLTSMPRFEPLLFWLPFVLASARVMLKTENSTGQLDPSLSR